MEKRYQKELNELYSIYRSKIHNSLNSLEVIKYAECFDALQELIDIYESLEKNLTLNNLIKCSCPRGDGRSMTHAEEMLKDILTKKSEYNKLQELIDKGIPKKVIEELSAFRCPECGLYMPKDFPKYFDGNNNYCPICGQSLDWGKENG